MASSKRNARDRSKKKRVTKGKLHPGIRCRGSTRRKRANTPYRRQPYGSVSIPQLVYELLTIDKYNQEAKRFQSPERFRTPRRRIQKYHERQRLPYEVVDRRDSPESDQVPEYGMESRPMSIESLTESMDAANNSAPSSANSSVSNISMKPIALANSLNSARALFRKKSLVQVINNYIKAGIEEGKRQAKKYICKALSFGVRSGYLIPADRQGNVLHVCPTLDMESWSTRRADVESRRRRRVARRGETRPTTIDDRKAMRRGIPRNNSRHDVDQNQTTRSKRRHFAKISPRRSLDPRESKWKKSSDESLRERNKPKTVVKRKSKINDTRGQWPKRRDDEDVKKSVKRRRMASSSKRIENNQFEPIEQSCTNVNEGDRNQYRGNEDNCATITERRKSTSSQEDESGLKRQKAGTSIDDNRENTDRKNVADDDDDEKSDEASVEHNINCTIREMDA